MKHIFLLLTLLLMISGCYTMINHPKVEVYYEKENGEEYLTEDYDVFVDEDCSTCHDEFFVQQHFSPLIPAHNSNTNWDDIPWWLDTKYLMFFSSGIDTSESGDYGYQHVNSQQRTQIPSAQQGGYLPNTGGGASAAGGSSAITPSEPSETSEGSNSNARTSVSSQNSGSSSKSTETTSKRKFRKRK
jgi:hypothetical protein